MLGPVIRDIFPSRVMLWHLQMPHEFDRELVHEILGGAYSDANASGEIVVDNLAEDPSTASFMVVQKAIAALQDVCGPGWVVSCSEAHGIVRNPGGDIGPHADSDIAKIQCHYFPMGDELEDPGRLLMQANQRCDNALVVMASDHRAGGYGADFLPWEPFRLFWLKPIRGLLAGMDARLTHFQKPWLGDGRFVQLVMNFSIKKNEGTQCIS